MRVTCPKCQFENQADSNRVVCARCATIIEVRPEAGGAGYDNYNTNFDDTGYGASGFDDGLRSTASYTSPYPGGNYGSGGNNYPNADYPGSGGYANANYPTAPVARPSEHDVYATKIEDDFDDVLDIPRNNPPQQGYQMNDTTPVYEDVFATPDYGTGREQYSPADQFQGGGNDQYRGGNMGEPHYDAPSYGVSPEPEFMGWPVLPEDSTDPGLASSSAFDKKSSLFRVVLIVAAGLGLLFIAWTLLSGPVGRRTTPTKKTDAVNTASTEVGGEDKSKPAGSDAAAKNTESGSTKTAEVPKDGGKAPGGITGPAGVAAKPEILAPKTEKSPVTVPPINAGSKVLQPDKTTITKADSAPPTPNRGGITVQVCSFNDRAQADDRVSRLKDAGVQARVVTVNIPGRGTWHRVQVGRFLSREQAASYASQLRGRGLVQDFMVTPVN